MNRFQGPAVPSDIDWSPDANQLAVLSYRTTLQIWNMSDPLAGRVAN